MTTSTRSGNFALASVSVGFEGSLHAGPGSVLTNLNGADFVHCRGSATGGVTRLTLTGRPHLPRGARPVLSLVMGVSLAGGKAAKSYT
jgi:hypothetical protein